MKNIFWLFVVLLMLITLTGSLDGAIKFRENFLEEVLDLNDTTNEPVQGYDYYPVHFPVEHKKPTTTCDDHVDEEHVEEEEHIIEAPKSVPAPAPVVPKMPVKMNTPSGVPSVANFDSTPKFVSPYSGQNMFFAPF